MPILQQQPDGNEAKKSLQNDFIGKQQDIPPATSETGENKVQIEDQRKCRQVESEECISICFNPFHITVTVGKSESVEALRTKQRPESSTLKPKVQPKIEYCLHLSVLANDGMPA